MTKRLLHLSLWFTVLFTFGTMMSQAQNKPAGKTYQSTAGFNFVAPNGWNLQSQENGSFGFLKAGSQQNILAVSSHAYGSVQAIMDDIYDQNDAASNTFLKAKKARYGTNGVLATFEGTTQGIPYVLTVLSLLSPQGGGAVVTSAIPKAEYTDDLLSLVKSVAATVVFGKPSASPVAEQWRNALIGKQLLYLYTGNGYSEKLSFDFCANGIFVKDGDTSYSSGGDFSAVTQGGGSGTWRVAAGAQVTLTLTYRDGNVAQLSLQQAPNGTSVLLNGKKYFVRESSVCR
jgi:hypothetical protein